MAANDESTGKIICGAKTSKGAVCQRPPVKGRTRCHLHGGATPRGPESVHYKHGRYTKYLPPELLPAYQAALEDPDILSAREEVALLHVRVAELSKNLFTGESGTLWAQLLENHKSLLDGVQKKNATKIQQAIKDIGDTIHAGVMKTVAWQELVEAIEHKTNVQQKELRRLQILGNVITAQQAISMIHTVVGVVTKWVQDPETLDRISKDLMRMLTVPEGGAIDMRSGYLMAGFKEQQAIKKQYEEKAAKKKKPKPKGGN